MIMEQLTEQLTIRMSAIDMELLKRQAANYDRSVAWLARDYVKKGLKQN